MKTGTHRCGHKADGLARLGVKSVWDGNDDLEFDSDNKWSKKRKNKEDYWDCGACRHTLEGYVTQ